MFVATPVNVVPIVLDARQPRKKHEHVSDGHSYASTTVDHESIRKAM